MTDQPRIVTFIAVGGHHAAFLGVHLVGSVRGRAGGGAEWVSFLGLEQISNMVWHAARDVEAAKDALIEHVADWYEAAHQPLAQGQGERIARSRVAR